MGVIFIIVGGYLRVLHGAPVTTFDLDMVHSSKVRIASGASCLLSKTSTPIIEVEETKDCGLPLSA